MKTPKEYKIKNLIDIINCTNEDNIDNFLTDLKAFIEVTKIVMEIAEITGEVQELEVLIEDAFTWIDDGKNKFNISVGIKK